MNVLITTSSFGKDDKAPLELMKENGLEYILNPFERKLSEDELTALIKEHTPDYLIAGTERISSKALDIMKPYIKMISRCGVGMDGIDLEYAKKINISVTNTPDAPTAPVAELTLGIMLDLLRKVTYANNSIRSGKFEKPMGNLLRGKTVGIIGGGRIGSYLSRLLSAFGCEVIGCDPFIKNHDTIELRSFDEVIKESDILTLHIPFTRDNQYLINKSVLLKMKPTAYLLNVSRGGLVNETDLVYALENGLIAGAGIDCFEQEPYKGALVRFDNVVLTSHIGSYAREARLKQEIDSVKNILEVM